VNLNLSFSCVHLLDDKLGSMTVPTGMGSVGGSKSRTVNFHTLNI
jgi:hypothetical protein